MMSGNLLRVMEEVERVAQVLQGAGPEIEDHIEPIVIKTCPNSEQDDEL